MARTSRRTWTSWLSSVIAVLAAGFLAGWVFREHEPVFSAQEPPKENRLAKESSPYLLLHKHNPVDWFPWGTEAFEKAKREDKPIFLSVGYSSCYWCHVMERESFSDAQIAKTLNDNFVCIKVDREELPHVDEVYMNAVQAMGLRGGWPLSVFLTADRKPFFGGTYFPPADRGEMPGFPRVLERVLAAWRDDREAVMSNATLVIRAIQQPSRSFSTRKLDRQILSVTVAQLATEFDAEHGGFGFDPRRAQRPKFPQASNLGLLVYRARQAKDQDSLAMLSLTLDRLARGGLWDHVGGGFHRYSVDRYWRIPHFEKMLYDNAQLASVYLEAFELTKNPQYRQQADGIFEFVARELTAPEGGFYSALDAESEHEEGKYYVWTEQEVKELLGKDFGIFAAAYGLDGPPNFERTHVLQRNLPAAELAKQTKLTVMELERTLLPLRQKLLAARAKRPKPLLDTKILTDWNGLMIAALADGYRILGNDAYRTAAERAADFLWTRSRDKDGRLLHTNTAGQAKLAANLDDHAFLIQGLLALHRATNKDRWLDAARSLGDQMFALFWDESAGGFFHTAYDQDIVLVRLKSARDSVVPSGNSAAVRALGALSVATGDQRYAVLAGKTLVAFAGELSTAPAGQPHMVRGLAEFLDAGFQATGIVQQPGGQEENVVRVSAVLSVDRLQPGREFQVAVDLEIDHGWHIYGNPSSPPFLLPTTLKVSSELPLDRLKVNYPKGIPMTIEGSTEPVSGYGDTTRIRATARLGDLAGLGKGTIRLVVQFQACDNRRCLAPQRIVIDLPVEIVAANETVKPLFPEIFDAKSLPN